MFDINHKVENSLIYYFAVRGQIRKKMAAAEAG